jgi:predicted ATPase/signal transduction histidine kinase
MLEVDGFRILELLRETPNSQLVRAIRTVDRRPVLLDVMREAYPDKERLTKFKREYEVLRQLNGQGALRALGLVNVENRLVMVLEDIGGLPLDRFFSSVTTRPNLLTFLRIAIGLADCLGRVHAANVIHKNVQPVNILYHGETSKVRLIGFSAAGLLAREAPEELNPVDDESDFAFLSPEQTGRMNRHLDFRTDFYSLGVTFYQLLCGELPFEANNPVAWMHAHIARNAQPLIDRIPGLPISVSNIVDKLMAKVAEDRYQSGWGLKQDLELCLLHLQQGKEMVDIRVGEKDFSTSLHIPEKLYGRDKEVAKLLQAFAAVAEGPPQLMLVAGYSGIGKSSVVHEVHKPILALRGRFLEGKFEQYKQSEPYSAIIQAFRQLIRGLLAVPAEIPKWREALEIALDGQGRLITDVIPELVHLIGEQPKLPDQTPEEEQNRFNMTFTAFIGVFTQQPLTLFLDDLQWSDIATLSLLENLMTTPDCRRLMVICAYRDNEVDETHPFTRMVRNLESKRAPLTSITLSPLDASHVTQLLCDTLHLEAPQVSPLTQLLMQKTGGNPFFLNQFLRMLYSEKWLFFDVEKQHWAWDTNSIQARQLTDNVVHLLLSKMQSFPEETRNMLRLGACIGASFNLETLAIIAESPQEQVANNLWVAIRDELVVPKGEDRYWIESLDELDRPSLPSLMKCTLAFLHDRVQQAAYELIHPSDRPAIHLKIGRLLLSNVAGQILEGHLFDIVEQLNAGRELIDDREERIHLAELNLRAGLKARNATAFETAARLALIGIEQLPEHAWQDVPTLTHALYELAAETCFLTLDRERAELLYQALFNHVEDPLKRAELCAVRLLQFTGILDSDQAAYYGITGVRYCGVAFPEEDVWHYAIKQEARKLNEIMGPVHQPDMVALDEMDDPLMEVAIRLLSRLGLGSYVVGNQPLFVLSTLIGMNLTLRKGRLDLTAHLCTLYSALLVKDQRYAEAYHFCRQGLSIMDLYPNCRDETSVCNEAGAFGLAYGEPFENAIAIHQRGYQVGFKTGDNTTGTFNYVNILNQLWFSGAPLDRLRETQATVSRISVAKRVYGPEELAECFRQLFDVLESKKLPAEVLCEAAFPEELWTRIGSSNISSFLLHFRLQATFWTEDYVAALDAAEAAEDGLKLIHGYVLAVDHYFLAALTAFRLWDQSDEATQQRLKTQIDQGFDKILPLAQQNPGNFLHGLRLLDAEQRRIDGKPMETVIQRFEEAIENAAKGKFHQYEALAYELLGRYWISIGKPEIASVYLQNALRCYRHWGAKCKVDLLSQITRVSEPQAPVSQIKLEQIELAEVMKAARIISEHIVLDKLITELLNLLILNSGAEKAILIMEQEQQWYVKASAHMDHGISLESVPVEGHKDLATTVIDYVFRTKEQTVLHHACAEGIFTHDPYIELRQVKSLLCLPIMHRAQLIGVLYMENNLSLHAFHASRLALLELLTSQAAVSIANAQLYADLEEHSKNLEQKVEERTREILQRQKQLVAQQKMASLGKLTTGIAHEIRNPLNFINNFASSLNSLQEELREVLADCSLGETQQEVEDILNDMTDSSSMIHKHGTRANGIVSEMIKLAGGNAKEQRFVDIHNLLEEFTNLAYKGQLSRNPDFKVCIQQDFASDLQAVKVYPQELARLFVSLINNACESMLERKRSEVEFEPLLKLVTAKEGEGVMVRIIDNGVGIPKEIMGDIFNPFFTTKTTGHGHIGLGLAASFDIAQLHHGSIQVNSTPYQETEFLIRLGLKP